MYTMMQVCRELGISYQTLKFYCNEGLVPGVQRDKNNRRIFDEATVKWIHDLGCLKKCGMSLAEMKEYLALCMEGPTSIPPRQQILIKKQEELQKHIEELQESLEYIEWKLQFYEDVSTGRIPYRSNLIKVDTKEKAEEK